MSKGLLVHIYGLAGYNLGDDAIAFISASLLSQGFNQCRVRSACINPGRLEKVYGHEEIFIDRRSLGGLISLVKSIQEADLVVIGGGTLIQDKLGISIFRGVLAYTQQIVSLARLFKKPIVTLPIGIDELSTRIAKKYAKCVIQNTNYLLLRDEKSLCLARQYNGKASSKRSVRLGADPAFLIENFSQIEVLDNKLNRLFDRYIVISLAGEKFESDYLLKVSERIIDFFLSRDTHCGAVLLAMDDRANEETMLYKALTNKLKNTNFASRIKLVSPKDARVAFAILKKSHFLLAMRLHAMIFGLGYVPIVGLSRTTKTDSFLEFTGVPGFRVDRHIDVDKLVEVADLYIENKAELKKQLRKRIILQKRVIDSIDELIGICKLLCSRDL